MEGKELFLHGGGERIEYIPCLNEEQSWVNVVKTLAEEKLNDFYFH